MNLFQILIVCLIAFVCAIGAREAALKQAGTNVLNELKREQSESNKKLKGCGILLLNKLGGLLNTRDKQSNNTDKTKLQLVQSGLHIDTTTWYGIRIACMFAFVIVFTTLATLLHLEPKFLLCVAFLCAVFGIGLPPLYLASQKKKRTKEISTSFPSSLELLSCSVRSGYTLERSIRLVGTRTKGALAGEFRRVDQEINLLNIPLAKSLERMKERCDVPCVTYFVNAMTQAHKQGTSVGRTLNTQAKAARNQYYADTLVKINELPNKMVPVIFIVFFPIIIVLAVGPVIYNAAMQFSTIM